MKWMCRSLLLITFLLLYSCGSDREFEQTEDPSITRGIPGQGGEAPAQDNDNDGVPDSEDACPDTPPGISVGPNGCAQQEETTYVPDNGFEQTLIDQGLDDELDDYVLTEKIAALESFSMEGSFGPFYSGHEIADLTGLEAFSGLLHLELKGINTDDLPLEGIQNLESLILEFVVINNGFSIINSSLLEAFNVIYGTVPDTISGNSRLLTIGLFETGGRPLIKDNPLLKTLNSSHCNVKEYVFENNPALEEIILDNYGLEVLEITGSPGLITLMVEDFLYGDPNPIGNFDLSGFLNLQNLTLLNCDLTSLDVSNNPNLESIDVRENQLSCIRVSQEQLDNIPQDWNTDSGVDFSLECK